MLGIVFAPQLAQLLTTGVSDPEVAAQQDELATYLLRFFIPQVLLYAVGAVATAVLHARGRFALPAIAPIGNTIVIVVAMLVFRSMAGDGSRARPVLGRAAVPRAGRHARRGRVRRRCRPSACAGPASASASASSRPWADRDVRSLLHLSGWAALQHTGTGILLAAALVVGGGVAGGVVAYQLAMVVFLAPYGIVAQPIHTAVLPRLSAEVSAGDDIGLCTARFAGRSRRWRSARCRSPPR